MICDGDRLGFLGQVDNVSFQNDEFCIQNDEFRIKNDEFRIKNDGFCVKSDGFRQGAFFGENAVIEAVDRKPGLGAEVP